MKTSNKNRAVLAEVIAKAMRDPRFRAELKRAPKQTLVAAGAEIPATTNVEILENTDKVMYGVLPPHADQHQYQAKLDEEVKKLNKLPEHVEVRIMRDTPNLAYLIIPQPRGAAPGTATGGRGEQLDAAAVAVSTVELQTTATTTTVAVVEEVNVAAEAAAASVAVVVAVFVPCFVT
jgi:hypothetical protein